MIIKEKRVNCIPLRNGGVQINPEELPGSCTIVYVGDVDTDDTCLIRYIKESR